MATNFKLALLSMVVVSGVGGYGCSGGSQVIDPGTGGGSGTGGSGQSSGGTTGTGSGGTTNGSGGIVGSGGSASGGQTSTGSGGDSTGTGGTASLGTGGSESGSGGSTTTGTGGKAATGGATGSGGATGTGGVTAATGGVTGTGTGGATAGSGGATSTAPINVLVWNNALAYGHAARGGAITYLKQRETTDNLKFDTTYAHPTNVSEGPSDTSFDASVFTDAGLDKYDVVLFLDTTGTTIDDGMKNVRRQALQDFIEKKGRGFVGTHSATDTYQGSTWPWYVDFIGANFADHSNAGTAGTAKYYESTTMHPILTAGNVMNPWNRNEEWYTLTRDPLSSKIAGIKILLTCHDSQKTQERPSAWIHEMPIPAGGTRAGRMFYTAFGHSTSAFMEKPVMDMLVAAIKWAAYRL